jgi:hypothetical protein
VNESEAVCGDFCRPSWLEYWSAVSAEDRRSLFEGTLKFLTDMLGAANAEKALHSLAEEDEPAGIFADRRYVRQVPDGD